MNQELEFVGQPSGVKATLSPWDAAVIRAKTRHMRLRHPNRDMREDKFNNGKFKNF